MNEKNIVKKLKELMVESTTLTREILLELGVGEEQLSKYKELLQADSLAELVVKTRIIEHIRATFSGYGASLDQTSLSVRLVSKGSVAVFYPTKNKWVYGGKTYKGLCSEFVSWLKRTHS